jgi:exodeoxyribonuclease-1
MQSKPTQKTDESNSLYWHDYETFGTDPGRDRPAQFAGIRTDEELNIISDPLVIYCQPANDFLPDPKACLITGISPQHALDKGIIETEFIKQIHHEIAQPGTCTVGYNNLRFDDEFTRFTLYRNFYDPYAREWQNDNSRWDIIDLIRLTRALRPKGIQWPKRDDGLTSFRLEQLSEANDIMHESAHDALSDVLATIEIARLVRIKQPRLYQYIYNLRKKHKVLELINIQKQMPFVHISGMYPAARGHLGIVVPVAFDPGNKNAIIVYELHHDPAELLTMNSEQIKHFTFTRADELNEGEQRLPLKTIHINKCPVVVPLKTLTEDNIKEWQINLRLCERNLDLIKTDQGLPDKIQQAFKADFSSMIKDPDQSLYSGGFFTPADKERMQQIRETSELELGDLSFNFDDSRLDEMLFRYRCRNYPNTLLMNEITKWDHYRTHRMTAEDGDASIKLHDYLHELDRLDRSLTNDIPEFDAKKQLLQDLKAYPELIGLSTER